MKSVKNNEHTSKLIDEFDKEFSKRKSNGSWWDKEAFTRNGRPIKFIYWLIFKPAKAVLFYQLYVDGRGAEYAFQWVEKINSKEELYKELEFVGWTK